MRCTRARKQMSAYLDGELGDAARSSLARHLESCSTCRGAYAALEGVHGAFARAERYEAPPGLSWRVAAALRAREAGRRPLFPIAVRMAAQAIALTAVVAAGSVSGKVLAGGPGRGRPAAPAAMFSLDLFAAAPPDSPGGAYLAMTDADHE